MYDRYKRTLRHLQGEEVLQKTIDEAIIFGVLVFLASKLSQAMKQVDPEMDDGSDGDLSDAVYEYNEDVAS